MFEGALLTIYYTALVVLVLYGVHRLRLTLALKRPPRDDVEPLSDDALPVVTVQLPMYNEYFVVERLLRAVAAMDYPRDKLQIQVLDDSTDESRSLVDAIAADLAEDGVWIDVVRREERVGYKAGALDHGLKTAQGELIAIFDADFVPNPDFLRRAVPHFGDERVGLVQGCWEHLNPTTNLLTRAQAILLDGHFIVEQAARAENGYFLNFNGTAGVWRRATIDDAGGWQHDTLTEDLDLSYRAQLAGWRFVYLADLKVPAELPAMLSGFKSQQHRWAKGSIETMQKLLGRVMRSDLPAPVKLEAFVHLTANTSYLWMLVLAVCMPLVVQARDADDSWLTWALDLPLFLIGTCSIVSFYVVSQLHAQRGLARSLLVLPLAIAVDIGLSIEKSRAVLEAFAGYKTAFRRTPKFAIGAGERLQVSRYLRRGMLTGVPELTVAIWYVATAISAGPALLSAWGALPFMALFCVGFGYVGLLGVRQSLPTFAPRRAALREAEA